MPTIMVVDDMAIFRDPIAASLRLSGYRTLTACHGKDALAQIRHEKPDLILLDLAMPVMDGTQFLGELRADANLKAIPVILLTASSEKRYVIQAAQFGVRDYLLKSRFSMEELRGRIGKYIPAPDKPEVRDSLRATSTPVPPQRSKPMSPVRSATPAPAATRQLDEYDIPSLMTREACLRRATTAMEGKALSGIVAQVIGMASSPRADMMELAQLISKDPILSARMLQAANSAAYLSARGTTTTVIDAVRKIGCATVRNIATAMGLFEAMPAETEDGFSPIRCWQHSFATATLCERMAGSNQPGIAYLVGLCHDLGEILLHTHFGPEYKRLREIQLHSAKPREELERLMLGLTSGDLALFILKSMGLPLAIHEPIEAFHSKSMPSMSKPIDRMVRILRLADLLANGMLLASSTDSPIRPIRLSEWRQATGSEEVSMPDGEQLRNEVFILCALLGRLSPKEQSEMMKPILPRTEVRIVLARESSLCPVDPIFEALRGLADASVIERFPAESAGMPEAGGLVVTAPKPDSPGFSLTTIESSARRDDTTVLPLLWLVGPSVSASSDVRGPIPWPIPLKRLAEFVRSARSPMVAANPESL